MKMIIIIYYKLKSCYESVVLLRIYDCLAFSYLMVHLRSRRSTQNTQYTRAFITSFFTSGHIPVLIKQQRSLNPADLHAQAVAHKQSLPYNPSALYSLLSKNKYSGQMMGNRLVVLIVLIQSFLQDSCYGASKFCVHVQILFGVFCESIYLIRTQRSKHTIIEEGEKLVTIRFYSILVYQWEQF